MRLLLRGNELAITTLKLVAIDAHAKKPLNEALADWLMETLDRPVSRAKARKLIIAGAVFANGRRVTIPSQRFSSGTTIEARIDLAKLFDDSTSCDREFELTEGRILFEDEDLIFIDKPPGLPAQPTLDETRDSLFAALGRYLAKRERIAKPYVGVHHRLDRDTSGVVFFTKSRRVNASVAASFSDHRVIKVYQAITVSRPLDNKEWTVRNYLGRIPSKSKRSRYAAVRSAGDFAETSFRVIEGYARGLWVEAKPKTGRTHQIRVHLSEYGLPILGDDLYGAGNAAERNGLAPRLMLHAVQVALPHPITGRELSVSSPLPGDFGVCLEAIRKDARS
jgi:23S rRNA pseudouridine1911/1915/1917 synthase